MNKESIYKIIGYKGEYNTSVKKAIRKLLKENHPDNKGDRKVFELVNEVKKELEENRVSIDYNNSEKSTKLNDDIDYDYCTKMLNKLNREKGKYSKELETKKKELSDCISEYSDYYNDSIKLENYLLSNTRYMNKLQKIKLFCIIMMFLATIVFIASVITEKIVFLGVFVILALFCLVVIDKAFFVMKKIVDNNRNKVKKYVSVNNEIRLNKENQERLNKEIKDLSKKISIVENNIRFYNNLINNR